MKRLSILLVCLAAFSGPSAAQTSQDDRSYFQAFLEDSLSDAGREVRITGFEGALSARATIAELTIADTDGVWLTLRGAVLDWNRSALLRGRLEVAELSAETLLIARRPVPAGAAPAPDIPGIALPDLPAPEATRFALPELPVSISIGSVSIGKVALGEPLLGLETEVSLDGSAELESGVGRAALEIKRIDAARGALNLAGSYSNVSRDLDLSLTLSEGANGIAANLIGLPGRPAVDLRIAGAGPIGAFTAGIELATDGIQRLGGEVTLAALPSQDGAAMSAGQSFSADIGGDIRPLVLPQYRAFLGPDIRLGLRGTRPAAGGLRLDDLRLTSDAMTLTGAADLGPGSWPLRIDLSGRIASANGTDVLLSLPGPETRIRRAEFSARFDAATGADWSADLTVQGFRREAVSIAEMSLKGTGQLAQGSGAPIGRVNGALDMALSGLLPLDEALAQALGTSLRGKVQFDMREGAPLTLPEIALTGADFKLTGEMVVQRLREQFGLAASGNFGLDADDLSRFSNLTGLSLGGAAKLRIAGEVGVPEGSFDLEVTGATRDLGIGIARLDPLIAGESRLDLAVARNETGTSIDRLNISSSHADIAASADLTSGASSGRVTAQLADAGVVEPNLAGPASLVGVFRQSGPDWAVEIEAAGPGNAIAALNGTARVGTGRLTALAGQASLNAENIAPYSGLAGLRLGGGIEISAEGNADLGLGTFAATLNGTGQNLAAGHAQLDPLLRGESKLASALRRDENGIWVFDRMDLVTPQFVADVTGSHGPSKSRLRFNLDLRDIGLFAPDLSGPVAAEGVATSAGTDWTLDSKLFGAAGTNAAVAGQISPDASRANLTITGSAPLALANGFIAPNLATGTVGFDLALAGPVALSSLTGTVRTDSARVSIPGRRVGLDGITATAQLGSGGAQIDAAATLSSGGRLSLSGPIALTAPYPADLSVLLSSVGIIEPGIYETTVDGKITVRGALAGGAGIEGTLSLGTVEIRVPETAGTATLSLPGLIHENEPAAARQTRVRAGLLDTGGSEGTSRAYPLDLVVNAPARIFIRGRGLDAELGGSLRLRGTTAQVIPDGRFDLIRGRLDILGKRLALTEAFVQLQGEFDPYLRIVADTESGGVSIRFVIEGPLSAPTVTMSSNPFLPEDEILARLLFGRNLAQISALQALQIAAAVNTLAGGGGTGIIDRLRESFGLDDLDVSTTETGQTGVRVGKYITENIYSDVTVDSAGQSEINLNLTITPSLTARGTLRSDGNSGLGLFFEKDY